MSRKVLIADADKQLQPVLKEAFRRIGFEALVEVDPQRIVELAKRQKPDLILLSVELPAGAAAGYLVCKDLKTDGELKEIPVLLTSRKAREEDFAKHRRLKTRADDYLRKPFTDEDLFRRIENLLGFDVNADDYSSLEQKMHTFLEEQSRLEDAIRERDEEIAELQQRVKELEAELEQQEEALHGTVDESELEQRDARIRELEARVAELEKELEAAAAGASDAAALAERAEKAEAELVVRDERITELDAQVADLQDALSEAEAARSELAGRVETLEGELSEQSTAVSEREQELRSEYETKILDLEASLEGYKRKSQELAEAIREAESQRDEAESARAELESQLGDLEGEVERARVELEAARAELESLRKDKETAESELAERDARIDQLEKLSAEQQETLETQDADITTLQNQLDASLDEIRALEKELKDQFKVYKKIRTAAQKVVDLIPSESDDA